MKISTIAAACLLATAAAGAQAQAWLDVYAPPNNYTALGLSGGGQSAVSYNGFTGATAYLPSSPASGPASAAATRWVSASAARSASRGTARSSAATPRPPMASARPLPTTPAPARGRRSAAWATTTRRRFTTGSASRAARAPSRATGSQSSAAPTSTRPARPDRRYTGGLQERPGLRPQRRGRNVAKRRRAGHQPRRHRDRRLWLQLVGRQPVDLERIRLHGHQSDDQRHSRRRAEHPDRSDQR